MKSLVYGFAQLAAVIVILITLAVSTAAVAQWAGDGQATNDDTASRQPGVVVASR
ncbi:MAG TPA: hypothetical protein VGV38_04410 [Pyrinomonadaceae bacterium]|nr:hypothetical protein [Pyrinomonadaceae bacterium]